MNTGTISLYVCSVSCVNRPELYSFTYAYLECLLETKIKAKHGVLLWLYLKLFWETIFICEVNSRFHSLSHSCQLLLPLLLPSNLVGWL